MHARPTPAPFRAAAAAALLLPALLLFGCGGGSGSGSTPPSTPAITVTLTPSSAQTIDQAQTIGFTASVANDTANKGVSWSVTGGGALSNETSTSATYTAPASVTGSTKVTVTAASVADSTKTASVAVTVAPAPVVTTTTLAAGAVNAAYSTTLIAAGGSGTLTWKVSTGTLPAGLALSAAGVLSGTPTAAAATGFSVTVTDGAGVTSAAAALSLTIAPAALAVTTSSLAVATVGASYTATLAASGGTGSYAWSLSTGALPAGLSLSAAGAITGTPINSGTSSFTVQVADAATPPATATHALTLTVNPAAAPLTITTTTLTAAAAGQFYSATLAASGGTNPYTWSLSAGALPAGLSLSAPGVISGTPTAATTASFTVQVADAETPPVQVTQALSLVVHASGALVVSTTSLPAATVGATYQANLQANGGTGPYTWSVTSGALPTWASLNAATGAITGTPDTAATTSFTVKVADAETPPASATAALSIAASLNTDKELNGQYAFLVSGFDSAMTASITVNGSGTVTGGEEDLVAPSTSLSGGGVAITSGTYSVGADNRGTLDFTDANGNTFAFDFALGGLSSGVATQGAMIETDSNPLDMTGSLAQQSASAFSTPALTGSYAFGFPGWNASLAPVAAIGSFTSNAGAVTNGLTDENDAGTLASSVAFTGSFGTIDTHGRGTLTISLSAQPFACYIVSAARMLCAAPEGGAAVSDGEILQQTGGPFTAASLNGNTVMSSQSSDGVPSPFAQVGIFTFDGAGGASASFDENDGGTINTPTNETFTGLSYTVTSAANGRITLTGGGTPIIGYMISANSAFLAGTNTRADFGRLWAQAAGPFTAASVSGTYYLGTEPPFAQPIAPPNGIPAYTIMSGELTADGAGNTSGAVDMAEGTPPHVTVATGTTTPPTFTVASNGRITSGQSVIYIVSSSHLILLLAQPNNPNPTIMDLWK